MPQKTENSYSGGGRFLARRESNPITGAMNSFLYSSWFLAFLGILTVISNAFAMEMLAYPIIIAISVYVSLCCPDMLPLMPILAVLQLTPSLGNNPGKNPDSIFFPSRYGILLLALLALIVVAQIIRFARDRRMRRQLFRTSRRLLLGMLILGGAYLLSGVGSAGYGDKWGRNLIFAALQFAAIFPLYWYFCGAVQWERTPKDYFHRLGVMMGLVLLAELGNIYLSADVIQDGVIKQERILTGWGMNNNIGGIMAMMLPFFFYYACRSKTWGWLWNLLGACYLAGIFLTCSRAAILISLGIYLACMVTVLIKAKSRVSNLAVFLLLGIGAVLALNRYWNVIANLWQYMISKGLNSVGRLKIYRIGLEQYAQNPFFGESFFSDALNINYAQVDKFLNFVPSRWHNTIVQVAAAGGGAALGGYVIHRFQTVRLFIKKENRNLSKFFLALSILALLGTSMLDCHFFNVGPTMFYSLTLAFAEKSAETAL